jgi:hypothetical protein
MGMLVIKLKNASFRDQLIKVTKLGHLTVKCYQPDTIKYKQAVIGPTGTDTPVEEIVQLLEESGFERPKAQRVLTGKGAEEKTTKTVKLWLAVAELPTRICLLYETFKVTPYIEKAWQCYKCQRFGHNANNCTNHVRCVLCTGDHELKECKNRTDQTRKCTNCGGAHTASYGGCKQMKVEKTIQKTRAECGLSYAAALRKVKDTKAAEGTVPPIQRSLSTSEEAEQPRVN